MMEIPIGTIVTLKHKSEGAYDWQANYWTYGKYYTIIRSEIETLDEEIQDADGNYYTETLVDKLYILVDDRGEELRIFEEDFNYESKYYLWNIVGEPNLPRLIKSFLIYGQKPTVEMLEKYL